MMIYSYRKRFFKTGENPNSSTISVNMKANTLIIEKIIAKEKPKKNKHVLLNEVNQYEGSHKQHM